MKKYDYAYMRIKDFGDELADNFSQEEFLHIVDCYKFCLAWCVFHANAEKKAGLKAALDSACAVFVKRTTPKNTSMAENIKYSLTTLETELTNYKKAAIDPQYLSDKSKENYNKLLELYLGEVCRLGGLSPYEGILFDFKHCMNELEYEPTNTQSMKDKIKLSKFDFFNERFNERSDKWILEFKRWIIAIFCLEIVGSVVLGIIDGVEPWTELGDEIGLFVIPIWIMGGIAVALFNRTINMLILQYLNNINTIRKNTEKMIENKRD